MPQSDVQVKHFGPFRAFGLSHTVAGGLTDFAGVWQQFMQMGKGVIPDKGVNYFGVCRCIPGKTDGSWEYVAAGQVAADAKLPAGLIELTIPAGEYAVITVQGLAGIGEAWKQVQSGGASIPGTRPYCGPDGCDCANHPSFEHYAADFDQTQRVGVYVPFRR